jgi:hypothetical protein
LGWQCVTPILWSNPRQESGNEALTEKRGLCAPNLMQEVKDGVTPLLFCCVKTVSELHLYGAVWVAF